MMCNGDAQTAWFSFRVSNQYIESHGRNWRISWQKSMAFPPKSLSVAHACTQISQIRTPVITPFALWQLKKVEKKKSLKSLIALIFNLAFTRAHSGLWDDGLSCTSGTSASGFTTCSWTLHKVFRITTLSISYWSSLLVTGVKDSRGMV